MVKSKPGRTGVGVGGVGGGGGGGGGEGDKMLKPNRRGIVTNVRNGRPRMSVCKKLPGARTRGKFRPLPFF